MLTDIALSVGAIFGLAIILGFYANHLCMRKGETVSLPDMLIIASIGVLVMFAFLAVFLIVGRFL